MARRRMHAQNAAMIRSVLLDRPPFPTPPLLSRAPWDPPAQWPARWLAPPAAWGLGGPLVLAYRLVIDLAAPLRTRIHVSADERYELWLDGERCGQGPERGDEWLWSYESHDLDLPAGRHVLTARVWALGRIAPWAQRSLGPGFICAAEGAAAALLGTGSAAWQVRRIDGYEFTDMGIAAGTGIGSGPVERFAAGTAQWDPADAGDRHAWSGPDAGEPGNNGYNVLLSPRRLMVPARLPAQAEAELAGWHAAAADDAAGSAPWRRGGDTAAWTGLLSGGGTLTVAPGTRRRVLVDLGTYACGRPWVVVDGGAGGRIALAVSEALVRPGPSGEIKGHRDAVDGARLRGAADELLPDGSAGLAWRPLWWRAGRWLEITAVAGTEPLAIRRIGFTTTGYPFAPTGGARGTDAATAAIHAACERTWRACAHETFMDCPHYEQLMYVGDTRVQALLTYALCVDDRLPRKALELFDSGRLPGRGLVPDAYPALGCKHIPPFALWWVAMVHDHAWWRGGATAARLPGVRAILDRFLAELDAGGDGLWPSGGGWNYLDWVPGSVHGTPPGGEEGGRNCSFNWQLVHALGQWADLEDLAGEPEQAARARRRRDALAAAIRRTFWDAGAGVFHEDPARRMLSEHAQVLALLSGTLDAGEMPRVGAALTGRTDLVRASSYFSHYLFEAYGRLGRGDLLQARLADWTGCLDIGLRTTPEGFGGEVRSDCHAWAAHPLFHHLATVVGIRPAAPGFARVRIAPQLGGLAAAAGDVAHPLGTIRADLARRGDGLRAVVELPAGLDGELVWAGRSHPLRGGRQTVDCA